ncbi:hypothetical protein IK146_03470 [Candidatus Saccharibacteria bacterium]|nr:hypothetical protein [Candidatus Saccharibacteria bacterium]
MRTKVEQIFATNRDDDDPVIISEDGNLKRRMLLAMLKKGDVKPSPAVVTLLGEAIAEIRVYYDSLPRDFGVSNEKFNKLWGSTMQLIENDLMDPTSKLTVDTLYAAHYELDELIKIARRLDRHNRQVAAT